jgi:hypothetical protein
LRFWKSLSEALARVVISHHQKGLKREIFQALFEPVIGRFIALIGQITGYDAEIGVAMPADDVIEAGARAGMRVKTPKSLARRNEMEVCNMYDFHGSYLRSIH